MVSIKYIFIPSTFKSGVIYFRALFVLTSPLSHYYFNTRSLPVWKFVLFVLPARTCGEWVSMGLTDSVYVDVDLDGEGQQQPFVIFCDTVSHGGLGVSVIGNFMPYCAKSPNPCEMWHYFWIRNFQTFNNVMSAILNNFYKIAFS